MEKYTNELMSSMQLELQKIATSSANDLQKAQRSFYLIEEIIGKLKAFIATYKFKDLEEEVQFFKIIKPSFQSEQIFFEKLYYIEARMPVGSEASQKEFINQYLMRIQAFFEENKYLYCYYLTDDKTMDKHYFVSDVLIQMNLLPLSTSDMDAKFSNPYSATLAGIQAHERLRDHLITQLNADRSPASIAEQKKKRRLTWTDSKSALIELIYAIHSRGSVNFGQCNIKILVAEMEEFFNVQLGNVYTVFLGMSIRKKSRTPYLDSLRDSLGNRFDDLDV
ncbi:RteC protein [Mucilaginibacter pineti]|uniref:RteC protein n=1 Tax=Mucilaginibacter pineti TaxID=1391627 RepID=A0A1G7GIN1_9SPHI|nr:RteC domain-containing protein [Mucilaginibacter pineti]SDE87997.1 RteC protein [Mucilaginibacter pineti]